MNKGKKPIYLIVLETQNPKLGSLIYLASGKAFWLQDSLADSITW
jgi:hypothetical protein